MARYRGIVKSDRGETSRLGHKRIDAWADGWEVGGYVTAYTDGGSADKVGARLTGGSNGNAVPPLGFEYDGTCWAFVHGFTLSVCGKKATLKDRKGNILWQVVMQKGENDD